MKKIVLLLVLVGNITFAQKLTKDQLTDKLADKACDCVNKQEITKENFELTIGICLLEGINAFEKDVEKYYGKNVISNDEKMEELIELLEEIQPDADFENCDTLIDDGILDSFAILSIVSELQDTYDITITPADIIPENFNSAKALWDMVCRLKG